MTHRDHEQDDDEEEPEASVSWRRWVLHWLKWAAYFFAMWLVLLPARSALADSALESWLADGLYVALAGVILAVIVFIDRRVVGASD